MKNIGHHLKVNIRGIFEEILNNNEHTWVMKIPLLSILHILAQVGERASELNDPLLNSYMLKLGVYDVADPKNENYDKDFVTKYLDNVQELIKKGK